MTYLCQATDENKDVDEFRSHCLSVGFSFLMTHTPNVSLVNSLPADKLVYETVLGGVAIASEKVCSLRYPIRCLRAPNVPG